MLVWPHPGAGISEILRLIKLPVARRAMIAARREGLTVAPYRFWQRGGGYDRNLWRQAEVREKIDYIHANPVRRGLVAHPRLWPWSSWQAWHQRGNDDPLKIDRNSAALS